MTKNVGTNIINNIDPPVTAKKTEKIIYIYILLTCLHPLIRGELVPQ